MKLKDAKLGNVVRFDFMKSAAFNAGRVVKVEETGVTFARAYVSNNVDGRGFFASAELMYFNFADTRFNGDTPESDATITLVSES